MRISISKEKILKLIIILLILDLALTNMYEIFIFQYTDEIVTLISLIYIELRFLLGKYEKDDFKLIAILNLLIFIGIISNIFSGISDNKYAITMDIISLCKIYICFLMAKLISHTSKIKFRSKEFIVITSKLLIYISFIFGCINIFTDINMSNGVRYGIRSFCFIFRNEGRYALVIAVCVALILFSNQKNKKNIKYILLGSVDILFSTKAVGFIIPIVFLGLCLMTNSKSKKKVSLVKFIPIIIIVICSMGYQINEYLNDINSPRMRLIINGVNTAISYAPFGSGFATYGSDMARRFYSPLYIQYGFNSMYGLSQESDLCLNDAHLAMIIGQFGFVGFLFWIYMYNLIFKQLVRKTTNGLSKFWIMGIFFSLIFGSIGTGTTRSSIGILCWIIIGIYIGIEKNNKQIEV